MEKDKLTIIYMGTPDFAVAPLQAILQAGHRVAAVVTVPDKPAGRGRKLHTSAVKDFAVENNLTVLQPEKLRDPEFVAELEKLQPDVMVVVAFRMLPEVVWRIPKMGTFNLHASLLPQYRGAAPINWAVINGEMETGVTTFLIDDKIDTGHILKQTKLALEENETAGTLHDKLMAIGAKTVVDTLAEMAEGKITPHKQMESATLQPAPKIFREDCQINWKQPGEKIEAFIRGMSPFPAAFTNVQSDAFSGELKITLAKFTASEEEFAAEPTLKIVGKKLVVLLPDGVLELQMLKPAGKRAMKATDFVNGIRDKEVAFVFI